VSAAPVRLRPLRLAAGMSQAELARAAGVSRQMVGAVEAGRHVPAVDAALRLATALRTTVEELFGAAAPAGVVPIRGAAVEASRVRAGRVGSEFVVVQVDEAEAGLWWRAAEGVVHDGELRLLPGTTPAGLVVAGCDPALGVAESLLSHLGPSRLLAVSLSTGHALEALAQGRCHGVAVHGPEGTLPEPPVPVRRFHLARWRAGIATASKLRKPSLGAIVGGRVPLVQRDPGAASQQALLRALDRECGPDARPAGPLGSGHLDVARIVSIAGGAGVTFEPAAAAFKLDFRPLETHVVELWLAERWIELPGAQVLGELLVSGRFGQQVALFGGYDLDRCGVELGAAA
jgi:transcriptional regulator with XRE-family HTH domain